MPTRNQKLWDTIMVGVIVFCVSINIVVFHHISEYQKSLDVRINEVDALPIKSFEETRSIEHRYFELLHKSKINGIIEEDELKYYNHLKQFYRVQPVEPKVIIPNS
jgi:hypothetical protein